MESVLCINIYFAICICSLKQIPTPVHVDLLVDVNVKNKSSQLTSERVNMGKKQHFLKPIVFPNEKRERKVA